MFTNCEKCYPFNEIWVDIEDIVAEHWCVTYTNVYRIVIMYKPYSPKPYSPIRTSLWDNFMYVLWLSNSAARRWLHIADRSDLPRISIKIIDCWNLIKSTNRILCCHITCICICLVSCVFFCWSCFTLSASSLLRPMSTSSLEGLTPDPPIGDLRPLGELNPTTKLRVQQQWFVSVTICLIWRTLSIE